MYCFQCGQQVKDGVHFCPRCGANLNLGSSSEATETTPEGTPSAQQDLKQTTAASFQQSRFIISIITMALCFYIFPQSCAARFLSALEGHLEVGGLVGLVLCICWWVAGIFNISKKHERSSARGAAISYSIAGVAGLLFAGSFTDLRIYGVASIIFAIICYLAAKETPAK